MRRYRLRLLMLIPWADVGRLDSPLGQLGGFYRDIACGVRRNVPQIFDGRFAGPLRPIGARLLNQFWDSVCETPPDPAVPQYPLGGQCVGIVYDLQLYGPGGNPEPWTTSSGGGGLVGPIASVGFELREPNPNGDGKFRAIAAGFTIASGATRGRVKQDPAGAYLYDAQWFAALYRTDLLEDTCEGFPPIEFPPVPPPLTFNIPIIFNNIQTSFPVNLPDLNVEAWPTFEFSPVFDLPDVTFEITPEGIQVPDDILPEWPSVQPPSVNFAPVLNAVADLDVVVQAGIGNINVQIGGLRGPGNVDLTELEELIRCCCCEEGVTYESAAVVSDTVGGSFGLPVGCVAVVVSAALPFTGKTPTIARSGSEDDVFLWGTFAIGYDDGALGTVERLSYGTQSHPVSERAVNITVTPHYGNVCTIFAVVKQKDC